MKARCLSSAFAPSGLTLRSLFFSTHSWFPSFGASVVRTPALIHSWKLGRLPYCSFRVWRILPLTVSSQKKEETREKGGRGGGWVSVCDCREAPPTREGGTPYLPTVLLHKLCYFHRRVTALLFYLFLRILSLLFKILTISLQGSCNNKG